MRNSNSVWTCAAAAFLATCSGPAFAVVSSNVGTNRPYSGVDINHHVGADRFYPAGFNGSRAIVGTIEGGFAWSGHETLSRMTTLLHDPNSPAPTIPDFVSHATAVSDMMGGRRGGASPGERQRGIAYGATMWSGSIGWEPRRTGGTSG